MRRWRLPPPSKRLRLPSSASGDETRSRDDTNEVERARGWPLWFCIAGRPGCEPEAQSGHQGPLELVNCFEASSSAGTSRSQVV